jgi:hypothetical protein
MSYYFYILMTIYLHSLKYYKIIFKGHCSNFEQKHGKEYVSETKLTICFLELLHSLSMGFSNLCSG